MGEPNYIVIRDPGSPNHGRWYDLTEMAAAQKVEKLLGRSKAPLPPGAVAITYGPTGEVECREDGAVAEVWRRVESGPSAESTATESPIHTPFGVFYEQEGRYHWDAPVDSFASGPDGKGLYIWSEAGWREIVSPEEFTPADLNNFSRMAHVLARARGVF